ncbi:hypothetical protein L1987_74244 [Smallanthus sonchifolius]|uniref:Uncharacterized protein n=1 Tax=Smallanthus sonchifolius TaxID=185202 RepID=A0ACB9A2E6_9ASTR|nr:hypothetical protein L1987_74244 [Smallanthus sonchifolius]
MLRVERILGLGFFSPISSYDSLVPIIGNKIEDVSGHVHAKTRQKSCSEAASSARCLVRVVGRCYSGRSIRSSLLIRQQRRARS